MDSTNLQTLSVKISNNKSDLNKMLGMDECSNEEEIAETEVFFESKDKSFYQKGIETLEKHWNECIALKGNYVDE